MRLPSPFSLPANCWKNLSNPLEAGRHCTVNRTTFYNKKKKEGVLRSNATLLPPFSINWKASMLRLKFTKRVRWLRQIGTCWSSRAWNPTGYETQQEREDFFFFLSKASRLLFQCSTIVICTTGSLDAIFLGEGGTTLPSGSDLCSASVNSADAPQKESRIAIKYFGCLTHHLRYFLFLYFLK